MIQICGAPRPVLVRLKTIWLPSGENCGPTANSFDASGVSCLASLPSWFMTQIEEAMVLGGVPVTRVKTIFSPSAEYAG